MAAVDPRFQQLVALQAQGTTAMLNFLHQNTDVLSMSTSKDGNALYLVITAAHPTNVVDVDAVIDLYANHAPTYDANLGPNGDSVLHQLAARGDTRLIFDMLERRSFNNLYFEPELRIATALFPNDLLTAAEYAERNGQFYAAALLHLHRAQPEPTMMEAVLANDDHVVDFLLLANSMPDATLRGEFNFGPAYMLGHRALRVQLLELRQRLTTASASLDHGRCLDLFIDYNTDPAVGQGALPLDLNAPNRAGEAGLHCGVRFGFPGIVQAFLRQHPARVDINNRVGGRTPLGICRAAPNFNANIENVLLAHGAIP